MQRRRVSGKGTSYVAPPAVGTITFDAGATWDAGALWS